MRVTVRPLDRHNLADLAEIDGSFVVDAKAVVTVEAGIIRWTTVAVAPYRKRYPAEAVDYAAYIDSAQQTIFLVYANGAIAGQVRMRRNWNGFAYVEDIAVDVKFRGKGIGRALTDEAARWAREQGLAGIMLETQDTNVAACRFYERCGFKLGGFDRLLYRGLEPGTEEIALFWYLTFKREN